LDPSQARRTHGIFVKDQNLRKINFWARIKAAWLVVPVILIAACAIIAIDDSLKAIAISIWATTVLLQMV
jgi:hypothetical protein